MLGNVPRNITRFIARNGSFHQLSVKPHISRNVGRIQAVNTRASSKSACLSYSRRSECTTRQASNPAWLYPSQRSFNTSCLYYDDFKVVESPPFADSISEGDVRWDKAVGDTVEEDEIVGEIETDKTSIPIPSPASGTIVEFFVEDGATVTPGTHLFKIQLSGDVPAAVPAASKPAEATATTPAPPQAEAPPPPAADVSGPIPTTPPPVPPVPAGPISSKPASAVPIAPQMTSPPTAGHPAPPTASMGIRSEQRVKMSRMRQRIAQRLKEAQNVNAMLTTFNEIDMSMLMNLRKKHKDEFMKKHNLKLGFMSGFLKAAAHALSEMPQVNAVIDDTDIVYRDYIDISVAVATPKGLVVPVIRNVETMNYAQIERSLGELGEKARSGNLAIEDMDGGTFTVSNGGVFGSMFGTPIINPPQSAILGMHAIFDRPVAIGGKVEIRPMMYVALTYDHRLIDGREAVTFLKKIKSGVEDPHILLLDL